MTTYLVGYDLKSPGQNYGNLIEHLNSYGTHWHILDSTWIIVTEQTAGQVRDGINPFLDSNDKVLVARLVSPGAWAGFTDDGTTWLQRYLD